MNDIMLDLETMGTSMSSVILSIGAVRFNPQTSELGETFSVYIDVDSSLASGCSISQSTLLWWMGQSDAARSRQTGATRVPLQEALIRFENFVTPRNRIWGNGADFDNALLGALYSRVSIPQPWSYWNNRCYRTMKNLFPNAPVPVRTDVKHDALDDAIHQAKHLQSIFSYINAPTNGGTA